MKANSTQRHRNNSNTKYQQKQNKIRMTLQEYLESINLRRQINSRSKINLKNWPLQCETLKSKLFATPSSIDYFRLNQEWKAKTAFNSSITSLKELCRQYISCDSKYIQIIRLIQKISKFVKNEIQTINKKNLLLQSFLVTEPSYCNDDNQYFGFEKNNDNLSKYLQKALNDKYNNQQSRIRSISVPDQNNLRDEKMNLSLTENKEPNHQKLLESLDQKYKLNSDKQKYFYSIKEKQISNKVTKNSKQICDNNFLKSFERSKDIIHTNKKTFDRSYSHNIELLKLCSQNEQEIHQLSLMSKYEQNKNLNLNYIDQQKTQHQKPTQIKSFDQSQVLTTQNHQNFNLKDYSKFRQKEAKVPLRQRKQKAQKSMINQSYQLDILNKKKESKENFISQDNPLFEMNIQMVQKQSKPSQKTQVTQNIDKNDIEKNSSSQKKNIDLYTQSPNTIFIQTPETLKKLCNSNSQVECYQNDGEQIKVIVSSPLKLQNRFTKREKKENVDQKRGKPNHSFDQQLLRPKPRLNIMKRYEEGGW